MTRAEKKWLIHDGGDLYGTVSRDGRYVAYTDWDEAGDLFVRDLVTGSNRRLTKASVSKPGGSNEEEEFAQGTAFSRDGRQVAFAWFFKGRYQLRIVRLDGSSLPQHRVLFDNEDVKWIWPEDWTPDGKLIAVGLQRRDGTAQVGLLSTDDGTLRVLKSLE